ncbi:spiro-SPASM protein [Leptospira broomii serovar Hurstbridge str. 5399]|uniref:Spiro-SPASM protein n=1 Tax=Leptospira broomii serovar Hurstbridge str. 5399 TaxID=1049789 RepID=T0FDE1_9LEPT|nr:spiro-SPASM protein [Leptospira broomii]EQA45592.1 spiro-SPASM protein [Leptospira broomii serovar Hurstbridge str. 5399]
MKFPPQAIAFYIPLSKFPFLSARATQETSDHLRTALHNLAQVFPKLPIYSNARFDATLSLKDLAHEFGFTGFTIIDSDSEAHFFSTIAEQLPPSRTGDPDWDEASFIVLDGIFPLLDPQLSREIAERHDTFLAQYSYSENLPVGIVPRILSREFVRSLPANFTGSTQDFLAKNINHYDTEIFYHSPDLRQWRLDFSLLDLRSVLLVNSFLAKKKDWKYEEILPFLLSNPDAFRVGPSYMELELFGGRLRESNIYPASKLTENRTESRIEPSLLNSLIEQHRSNFGTEYSVCFGGLGEPILHPRFPECIDIVLKSASLKELFIETDLFDDIRKLKQSFENRTKEELSKICLIINLSTWNKKTYAALYGYDGFDTVVRNLDEISQVLPKSSIYLQFLKLKEIDSELDSWYETTEKAGYGIILQKYNSYAGKLPERRAADLTPLEKEFCWHLARDLYVNADGSVAICKQQPGTASRSLGNLNSQPLLDIWKKGHPFFALSANGKHKEIPAPCLSCDEWYTFNA